MTGGSQGGRGVPLGSERAGPKGVTMAEETVRDREHVRFIAMLTGSNIGKQLVKV